MNVTPGVHNNEIRVGGRCSRSDWNSAQICELWDQYDPAWRAAPIGEVSIDVSPLPDDALGRPDAEPFDCGKQPGGVASVTEAPGLHQYEGQHIAHRVYEEGSTQPRHDPGAQTGERLDAHDDADVRAILPSQGRD